MMRCFTATIDIALHRPLALGQKIDRVMKSSQLVMAGNAYLADRARKAGAVHVEVVPTVVDLSAYSVRSQILLEHSSSRGVDWHTKYLECIRQNIAYPNQ